jgi:hydrogenase nickel incorporation protein HypA/HybF
MHELAVTESIVEIACRHALLAGADRVVRIKLVIGDLSSIVDDSVQFYFDFVSQNTTASGATLVFDRVPVRLLCEGCGNRWCPTGSDWECPACRQRRASVTAGREFFVESIEVEP